MDRLTPLATAFLDAEDVDARSSLAIGSLAVFEGPAPSFEEFVELIAGRLPLIPRYRQKLRSGPVRPGGTGVGRRPRLRHPMARAQHGPAPRPEGGRRSGA